MKLTLTTTINVISATILGFMIALISCSNSGMDDDFIDPNQVQKPDSIPVVETNWKTIPVHANA